MLTVSRMTVIPYFSCCILFVLGASVSCHVVEDCPRDIGANDMDETKASLDSILEEGRAMTSSLSLLQHTAAMMTKAKPDQVAEKVQLDTAFAKSTTGASISGRRSLMQRTASLKTATSETLTSAWPMAVYDPAPAPTGPQPPPPMNVVNAPLNYKITLAILSAVLIVSVVIFFYTEKSVNKEPPKQRAQLEKCVAISGGKFCDRKEQVLQDFLRDSDEIYLVPVDGRSSLTYKAFNLFLKSKDADVSRFGVAGNDRLATILGNGPETAVAFWAFSAQCQFCPINHEATSEEIDFTLRDLPAKAVVVYKDDVKRIKDHTIIECIRDTRVAGLFTLIGRECPVPAQIRKKEDVALVIQTSGTTKKPKIVPLTHDNLIINCLTIVEMIKLEANDRSLNFLPLFHIGGIANNVIAPVLSRSSVICADHFSGEEAFNWVKECVPSWYYGSPTTHILMMRDQQSPQHHGLRLIRNATAALLPSTAEEMYSFWGPGAPTSVCEILPGYGMSECTPIASHQTGKHVQLASVGPFAGPEVKIHEGEILIRGPMVFQGYEIRDHMCGEDPNKWIDGWFPTGDCGEMSADYLYIKGRNKEIIIRGGENISPFEVEDAIQDPRVTRKAAFSVSHEQLGEVVGLAVETTVPSDELLILFKSLKKQANLDPRKLPEVIVSVQELPKGLAGKTKRIGLQKLFSLESRSLERQEPVAYTFADNVLTVVGYEDSEDDDALVVDSLGLTRAKGGHDIPAEIRTIVLGMYAVAICMVVGYHAQVYLVFPKSTSAFGLTLIRMMGGNVVGGMRWTMQCFMACAAYLQAKEPFSLPRLIILCIMYFAYKFPITPAICFTASWVSNTPYDAWLVMTPKRWFLGVMAFSYASFAYFRYKPYPALQCLFWASLTLISVIWPVSNYALQNIMPAWFGVLFNDNLTCGLYCWLGCIMVYYVVGHYGHDIVARMQAHPLSQHEQFQRGLVYTTPVFFLVALFAIMWGPQQAIGIMGLANPETGRQINTFIWDPTTVILDQIVSVFFILLLSQAVRGFASWIAPIGACSLGIYLGGDICFFLPHGKYDVWGASFGVIVDRYEIIPTLQRTILWTADIWPAMVVFFFVSVVFQIFVFGIPFHKLYLRCVNLLDSGEAPKVKGEKK